ncbi:MAG: hypothetical protein AAF696_17745, partial [Bacteroidota bacterium]
AGAIYGWRDPHRAHWTEEYQRDLIEEFFEAAEKRPWIKGYSLWQFSDIRTYDNSGALRRPRAFNNKGLCDEYRRPKLVWDLVRQYHLGEEEASKRVHTRLIDLEMSSREAPKITATIVGDELDAIVGEFKKRLKEEQGAEQPAEDKKKQD